jgi:TM2 domain-containing membrane protein YozV
MYCSHCGNQLDDDQQFCGKCGTKVGGGAQDNIRTVYVHEKSAGLAAVLSFLFMGLGQIYADKIKRGVVLIAMHIIMLVVIYGIIIFGTLVTTTPSHIYTSGNYFEHNINVAAIVVIIVLLVAYLVIWIWNIFDAYNLAKEYNRKNNIYK